ncbi:hypothetical protein JCM15457_931 [Liquorilactobacillus sucicola DSM 21376 = JCM 15457]|uniref:Di-and tricarboxylate transporter n=1 Tax=Liquorilactobacillus sucicola DSM 21376 = JCM 15457 TaxID=1423806 RepID=A0A023CVX3_9LACO|nr:SLC13 family permease [Liquorilactobacillus sucicola]KRN06096.1 di- and tricarboxylate transporter [Liquorilactobacillus sucicola DSM 21376 = JCM 15457]GAJ26022.1 hypothetical protein JCM15457_931 [Liquorilactobacillus sucicola DSM 21376 = JCM 15457]
MLRVLKRLSADKTFIFTALLVVVFTMFGTIKFSDIDTKTILSLFSLLVMVSVYEQKKFFTFSANAVLLKCSSTREVILVMFLCSFAGSMLFTNDVAIITLVPIFFSISKQIKISKIMPICLLTIYANLGSAITTFGNPQNLYLTAHYRLSIFDFLAHSSVVGLFSLVSLVISTLFFPKKSISKLEVAQVEIEWSKMKWVFLATIIVLCGILELIPIWISVLVSLFCALTADKRVFSKIDYGIILTFINFFMVVGAVSRIDFVHTLLLKNTRNTLSTFISSVISSQFISNVPAVVLLSKFTNNTYGLYLGVTIGGLGTIIASLANLLALRQYNAFSQDHSTFKFFKTFTWVNVGYLAVFMLVGWGLIWLQ